MTAFTNIFEDEVLDYLRTRGGDLYLALFTTPTADDGTGTEATGGGYARQIVTFSASSGGTIVSDVDATFAAMTTTPLTHAALYDDLTAGVMLVHGPLAATVTPASGADVTFLAGELSITVD